MQALQLVEFAFQRYYRLDCSAERGLCERHARTTERVSAALRPAVALAQTLKDLQHPQDQAWMRHLLADAALNRFKHLEAGSGLRSTAAPMGGGPARTVSLDEYVSRTNLDDGQHAVRSLADAEPSPRPALDAVHSTRLCRCERIAAIDAVLRASIV